MQGCLPQKELLPDHVPGSPGEHWLARRSHPIQEAWTIRRLIDLGDFLTHARFVVTFEDGPPGPFMFPNFSSRRIFFPTTSSRTLIRDPSHPCLTMFVLKLTPSYDIGR